MNLMRLFVKYRFYGSFILLAIGILIHIFVHKGYTWSIFIYIISVSIILFDIFIGPMRYLQKQVEAGDIEGAKETMSWIKFPNLLIKPVRQGYYMLRSNFAMANQNLDEAEADIRKSLASKSDLLGGSQEGLQYLQLGTIALQKGDQKEALRNLKTALQKGVPDDDNLATIYLQLCTIYAQRREIKVAKEYLRRANNCKVKSDELKKHLKDINKQMARA